MSTSNSREKLGMLLVIISAVLFGMMPMLAKIAYHYGSNAYSVAFGRFFIGSVLLFVIIKAGTEYRLKVSWEQMKDLIKLSVFYALMPILLYSSYAYIDTGLATTFHFTYPIIVIVLLVLVFGEHISKQQILCIGICLVGIFLLYSPKGGMNLNGILLSVGSGIAYALYIILLNRSRIGSLPVLVVSFWIALWSCAEIGAAALFTCNFVFFMGYQAWVSEFVLALTATVIALVLFQKGVHLCGEIKASLLSAFEPVVGIMIGVAVFGEKIQLKEVMGIISILLAVILLVIQGHSRI